MGLKKKTGRQRLDKFYRLAKETGYRSRAAFKLIQLNRKFSFLEKSRVCIDLCAAPGGWMQVARKNMPVSSIVIGVDLVAIQAVPGCITLKGDITSDETAKNIQKELKTWKADLVLNDGAPNIGANWLHDAYAQICLSLSALKLAAKFLRKGGVFVSKVFRSKDYNAFVWVLKQFFQKVHATKPSASRAESAEIFIVCQGYLAPDRIDPKLFDSTYVFEELNFESENKKISQVMHPEKMKKPKAEGYIPGDFLHHKEITAKEFILSESGVHLLVGLAEIKFEDDEISNHPRTTNEIKECCKDLKVLNRKDLRAVLSWWKAVREDLIGKVKVEKEDPDVKSEPDVDKASDEKEEEELAGLDEEIKTLQDEEKAELRRKRKKVNKQRRKLQDKMDLKMVLKDDVGPVEEGDGTEFSLKSISNIADLTKATNQKPEVVAESEESEDDTPKPKKVRYDPDKTQLDKLGLFYTEDISDLESGSDVSDDEDHFDLNQGLGLDSASKLADSKQTEGHQKKKSVRFADADSSDSDDEDVEEKHPLITDLDTREKKDKRVSNAAIWFEKDTFKDLTTEADEDYELDQMVASLKKRGGQVLGNDAPTPDKKLNKSQSEDDDDVYSDDSEDSDFDFDKTEPTKTKSTQVQREQKQTKKEALKDGFEIVPKEDIKHAKSLRLDEEGLAIGTLMVNSAKAKRDIIDGGWNKWVFNDSRNLPHWFKKDEEVHMKKNVPIPQELVEEYKKKMQEINIRPIKKVIEAKARKKRRTTQRLVKAKKKLQNLMENVDVSNKEKARQIRKIYKAAKEKKKGLTYVIAKKNGVARNMRRPPNVKGAYKMVDPRMKKDDRKQKVAFKRQGGKGKSTKPVDRRAVAKMKKIQKIQNAARSVHTA